MHLDSFSTLTGFGVAIAGFSSVTVAISRRSDGLSRDLEEKA